MQGKPFFAERFPLRPSKKAMGITAFLYHHAPRTNKERTLFRILLHLGRIVNKRLSILFLIGFLGERARAEIPPPPVAEEEEWDARSGTKPEDGAQRSAGPKSALAVKA